MNCKKKILVLHQGNVNIIFFPYSTVVCVYSDTVDVEAVKGISSEQQVVVYCIRECILYSLK